MTPVVTPFIDQKINTASFDLIGSIRNHYEILSVSGGPNSPRRIQKRLAAVQSVSHSTRSRIPHDR